MLHGMTVNTPDLWQQVLPRLTAQTQKYNRGHAVVLGGGRMTGAARLASEAAMRMGAGLCTIICPPASLLAYQQGAPHILCESYTSLAHLAHNLTDKRRNAVLLGPGAGFDDAEALQQAVVETLKLKRATVLDADALTVFEHHHARLFTALHGNCVLTPHEGEFARLFPMLTGTRTQNVLDAAKLCNAVLLLKGAETLIATPQGELRVNTHASPALATAGAGDVLAGMILGLMAQGMSAFDAASAAAWIHGDAALRHGAGLVAPDIIGLIPAILKDLLS